MTTPAWILIIEAVVVYFVLLWAHSPRHRFGPVHFYARIGGLTAMVPLTSMFLHMQVWS